MNKEIKYENIWKEVCKKLEMKEFRYGTFPPKHGVNISEIKKILRPIIKRLTS